MNSLRPPAGAPSWRRRIRGNLAGLLAAVLAGAGASLLVMGAASSLRMDVADILARSSLEHGTSQDIVVVEIDEGTVTVLAEDYGRINEWPREFYGMVLDVLRNAGARRVVFDMLFDVPSAIDPGSDEVFAEIVQQAPDTVMGVNFLEDDVLKLPLPPIERDRLAVPVQGDAAAIPTVEYGHITAPFPDLLAASAAVGVIGLEADPDGVVRRTRPFYRHGGKIFCALGPAALQQWWWTEISDAGRCLARAGGGSASLPLDSKGMLRLRFLGDRQRYLGPSFGRVLGAAFEQADGTPIPTEISEAVRGKVVFIGTSAAGLQDLRVSPVSRWLPGVYLSATAAEDLLHNRWLIETPPAFLLAAALVFAAVGGLCVRMKHWYVSVVATLLLALLIWIAARAAFTHDIWFDPLVPMLSLWIGFTAAGVHRYLTEDYYKRKIRSAWGRYLSPEVIEDLSRRDFEVEGLERGVRKELTVLFSDIIGFTSMSEQMKPEEVVSQLNEYLGVMSDVIRRNRGTLDKYIGDAIMAFWGEPLEDPDHATHAVLAALEMVQSLKDLSARWQAQGKRPFGVGIGINTGPVVVGHFGGAHRNYTVIGDEVNIASRLEGLTRQFHADILVSAATAEAVRDLVLLEHIGEVSVKNREQPVDIYAVKGRCSNEIAP
ncbi:MAG: adenylate/guanylate cyclase domain-containing protein [Planctomycetes bacterium]|nr:adenylate/guanylate cyclase domain-containing protein [Planctomycetota bacterium]